MTFPMTVPELLIVLLVLVGGIILISLPRQRGAGYLSIIMFGSAAIVSSLLYLLGLAPATRSSPVVTSLLYLVIQILPATVLIFSLEYLYGRKQLSLHAIAAITLVPPLLFLFLVDRATLGLNRAETLGQFSAIYTLGMLVAALVILAYSFEKPFTHSQNRAVLSIVLSGTLSILIMLACIGRLLPFSEPGSLLLGFLLIAAAFIHYRIAFQSKTVGRFFDHTVWNSLDDGIIILNTNNLIVTVNSAAEQIIGVNLQESRGENIEKIFPDWSKIAANIDSGNNRESTGAIFIDQERRHLSIRVKPMEDENPRSADKILIIRDITDLKISTDARQFERETMSVFLQSLSIAYKDSSKILEFLERALYQTLYTFNIESGLIYQLEIARAPQKKIHSLIAKNGFLSEIEANLISVLPEDAFYSAEGELEVLIVPDASKDARFSRFLDIIPENFSLAFAPLGIKKEIVGVLVLGRKHTEGFTPQDIMRIGFAANEIASFVYKQQLEQQQTAILERQRLMRDLHDSITQKLYGLVTITEAVKVGLAAGAIEKSLALLPRVSDNARQALREMRLFLHELDPVDLEKIGLVSAIQQRLTAVEGRSNIKARLFCPQEISFSKEKERALYYIAEEALNNIVKHAQVETVEIKLRRRGKRVYLDIIDDGCGFDPAKIKTGGRGLRNMKERADQIGATFKIASGKKKGTRVSISFQE